MEYIHLHQDNTEHVACNVSKETGLLKQLKIWEWCAIDTIYFIDRLRKQNIDKGWVACNIALWMSKECAMVAGSRHEKKCSGGNKHNEDSTR